MKTYSVNSYSYSELSEKAKLVAWDSVTDIVSDSQIVWAAEMASNFQHFLEKLGLNVSVTYNLREGMDSVDGANVQLYGSAIVSEKDESENIDNRYPGLSISIINCYNQVMKDFRAMFGDEYSLMAGIMNEFDSTPIIQVDICVLDSDGDEVDFEEEDDKNALLLDIQDRLKEVYTSVTKDLSEIIDEMQRSLLHSNGAEYVLVSGPLKDMEFYKTGHVFECHDTMTEM